MSRWKPYTQEELKLLSSQNLTLPNSHLMICTHCNNQTVHVYIHDLEENPTKTAEWFWCSTCKRYVHHRVALLSCVYKYNDPLKENNHLNKLLLTGDAWYDFLDSLCDNEIFPQNISLKNKRNFRG